MAPPHKLCSVPGFAHGQLTVGVDRRMMVLQSQSQTQGQSLGASSSVRATSTTHSAADSTYGTEGQRGAQVTTAPNKSQVGNATSERSAVTQEEFGTTVEGHAAEASEQGQ
ncbi:hypothetical protein IAU59_003901 [Kwoniella sp. CBS 9459]